MGKISRPELLTVAIMVLGMVFSMSLFMTLLREGLTPDFIARWMSAFAIALPVVFPLALGMLQLAKKVVVKITKQDSAHAKQHDDH